MCLCANVCTMCCVPGHIHHVCVRIHICTCIWSAAVKIRHLSEALSTLSFETGSCTEPGLTYWLTALVTNLSDTQCHVFTASCIMVTDSHKHDKLYYMGPGDLNLGPHTCIVGSLPTESSPQSNISFLKEKCIQKSIFRLEVECAKRAAQPQGQHR